jgi:hypothetical protein
MMQLSRYPSKHREEQISGEWQTSVLKSFYKSDLQNL